MRQGQATPDPYDEEGSAQPAHSDTDKSQAAWGHALSKSGGTARRAHVGRQLSWGTKPKGWDIPSALPKGATLTPEGDLGERKQLEALKVFPALRKMTDHVKRASHRIPLKEKFHQ